MKIMIIIIIIPKKITLKKIPETIPKHIIPPKILFLQKIPKQKTYYS